MAFTAEGFQDLLRLLNRHPEWKAELRRHILSDDLLTLPELMRHLSVAYTRSEERLERVESLVEKLFDAQTRTEEQVAQLAAAQVRPLEQVTQLAVAQVRLVEQVT